jgi:hypothetical protein
VIGAILLASSQTAAHKGAMRLKFYSARLLLLALGLGTSLSIRAAENPYLGAWELTIPGGAAGWLGVKESEGGLKSEMMWGSGSVEPTATAKIEGSHLVVTRHHVHEQKDATGKNVKVTIVETITASVDGDTMKLTTVTPHADGKGEDKADFTGHRSPPMPPAPDLGAIKFGEPMPLFNGHDLTGWRLTDPHAINAWSARDGILVNAAVQEEGKPHKNYGNLRTDREFEDFNLKLEVKLAKGGNSGVYMRGIYEVQVADTYGKPLDWHNMGAVYTRIKPSANAEKPAGEWQTLDITFVDRHATVILNGKRIIDNQPVLGCTGGALWSDVSRPGPIYLQGDHTASEYRGIELRPRLK